MIETNNETHFVYIHFAYPTVWWQWFVAFYQRAKGVKHWRIVHVEILTEDGVINRGLGRTQIKQFVEVTLGHLITFYPGGLDVVSRARLYYYEQGDMGVIDLLMGKNCVDFTKYVLSLHSEATLPGELCTELFRKLLSANDDETDTDNFRGRQKPKPPTPPVNPRFVTYSPRRTSRTNSD